MRLTLIKIAVTISFMAIFLPQMASANASPSFSCSSNLVVSLHNGYQASCDGDFTFTDGVLENEVSISLIAGGMLSIESNFELVTPILNLIANSIVVNGRISQNYQINANTLTTGDTKLNLLANVSIAYTLLKPYPLPTKFQEIAIIGFNDTSSPDGDYDDYIVGEVPEPSSYILIMLGLATISFARKPKTN